MKAKFILAYYTALQEIRNYRFFYILVISVLLTLGFVPPHDAAYSTISFANWKPEFNSEWIGTTTAIMSTLLLSILGFYLIIDNLSKEKSYRTQSTIMVSPISNFRFLLYRWLSASALLMTILLLSMMVSILLSIYYNGFTGTSYLDIVLPYLLIAFPSALVIAGIALALEVLLPTKRMLRYLIFLVGFIIYLSTAYGSYPDIADPFGIQYLFHQLFENVSQISQDQLGGYSIGLSINNSAAARQMFTYSGTEFSTGFIFSRLVLVGVCLGFIGLLSLIFNKLRFFQHKTETPNTKLETPAKSNQAKFDLEPLKISPLPSKSSWRDQVMTEIFMFQKWTSPVVLLLTLCLVVTTFLLDVDVVHRYILPVIILLQVPVISDLITRDKRLRTYTFFKTSVISSTNRMLFKGVAAVFILGGLSLPLMLRYMMQGNSAAVVSIVIGLVMITAVSFLLGSLFNSKKPYELIMVLVTYACINQIEVVDYLGIYNASAASIISLAAFCIATISITLFLNSKLLTHD
ncbi:MAG: hypothetical protein AAGA77_05890 [Bacteroidota bacterium]